MPQRNDETTKRGYTSLDDIDPYPRAAYRDRDGRRYGAPGFTVHFDAALEAAKGRTPDLEPAPGRALVDVFVATSEYLDGAGVLLVDGEAVASGDGRYQFEVDPGRHRLEVQGLDATSTEFEAAAGERVLLTTGHSVSARRQVDFRTELHRVTGPEGLMPVSAANSGLGCLGALIGVVMVIVPAILYPIFSFGIVGETVLGALLLVGVVLMTVGFFVEILPAGRHHKRAKGFRLDPVRRADPIPHGFAGAAVAFPSPMDARDWAQGRRVRGVLLVFDLFFYRLTREPGRPSEYVGSGEDMAMTHAGGLRMWIDGLEAPCDWASWYYPLEAGEHVFSVEYDGGEARHEFTVKVKDHNDMTVVQVPVRVFRLWNRRTNRGETFESGIAHKVHREAKYAPSALNRNPQAATAPQDEWVPGRYWPLR